MSHRFEDSFRAGPGWNCSSILVLLESCLGKLVHLVGFIIKKLHVELNYEVAIHFTMKQELGNGR